MKTTQYPTAVRTNQNAETGATELILCCVVTAVSLATVYGLASYFAAETAQGLRGVLYLDFLQALNAK